MAAKKSGIVRRISAERIERLYELAKESYKDDPKLSKRYVTLIGRISKHYRIRLKPDIKRHICKKCESLLVPGESMTVRIVSSKRYVLYRCIKCGAEKRMAY